MLTFSFYTLLVIFIIVCLFLMLLILIQKGRGGGLTSAFGGAGGNTAFGSKTGDVLTWATSIVFGIFLVLAIVLNLISNTMDKRHREQIAASAKVVAPAPVAPMVPGPLPSDTAPPAPAPEPETPAPAPTTPPAEGAAK